MEEILLDLGLVGLFVIALLDSAMLPLAGGPDGVLVLLSMWNPTRVWLYTGAATIGSALGCLVLYTLTRRVGERMLSRLSPSRQEQLRQFLNQYGLLAIALAVFLPPPFPAKPTLVMAGILGIPRERFLMGVLLGRLTRYGLEGYLAARFGSAAMSLIKRASPWFLLGAAVLVVFLILLKKRRSPSANQNEA
ncbi:MAG: VTT domain-containing protein [Blastocatellia bacterium]|nr:VTT domain-containing protein [Blastocatellia bacterium]MCX7752767.1 VTT domain-containing protein [Blastocatellia bacterium]MDW8167500.1 VTT domain-containing protein [Acidobacteriota bacterium]MDW8256847.1 VTT domain-containing protein [Acidobacteriota bacterium]